MPFDCDVIVAGGGPAGSAAAAWLARSGHRVILFERDRFPRFHIGESLLASVNDALGAIGADDLVRQAGFPQKWGATFMTGDGQIERYADFAVAPDVRAPQTWQVHRATFDDLLLRHAAASGADVREQHRVLDVAFDNDGVTVTVQGIEDGSAPRAMRARAIVDASGRGALLSRKFNLRIDEPRLANLAVFSHYSGVVVLRPYSCTLPSFLGFIHTFGASVSLVLCDRLHTPSPDRLFCRIQSNMSSATLIHCLLRPPPPSRGLRL